MGGKSDKSQWQDSVETLDLLPFIRPGQLKRMPTGEYAKIASSEWEYAQPMKFKRANFSCLAV
jgi:hypothetical protein